MYDHQNIGNYLLSMLFVFLFLGKPILNFPASTFTISESDGVAELKLMLSKPLDCCTVSVRVLIEEIDEGDRFAEGTLYNYVLCGKYR